MKYLSLLLLKRLKMNNYKHLTLAQRYEIELLRKQGKSQKDISIELKVSKSTISREIERNSGSKHYKAEQAHSRYEYRKRQREAYKLTEAVKADILEGLKSDYSPEQIVGDSLKAKRTMVSHETIYLYIYSQQKNQKKATKGVEHAIDWTSCLRSKKKHRQKRKNSNQKRALIEGKEAKEPKVSIDDRPEMINNKERIGDCEIDTIIGKNHKGAILTLVERVTKHTSIVKLPNKTDDAVTAALIELNKSLPFTLTSITADNGTEFADFANIKKQLNCDFYFAHPYSSWERGLNENTNGLIRQYIPKKSDFNLYDSDYIRTIERKLNNRPRKTLDFLSPLQVLEAENNLFTSCT
jgi:transposase, IS30 family